MQGQTAIVTGAGAGIGEAIAHRLAAAGAAIAVVDVNLAAACRVAAPISAILFSSVMGGGQIILHNSTMRVNDSASDPRKRRQPTAKTSAAK